MTRIDASGEQGVALEVRGLPLVSLETRLYPTSMSEKLPFACFRLSEPSDMFFEQILPGCDGGVKAPRRGVGKHLFSAHFGLSADWIKKTRPSLNEKPCRIGRLCGNLG